MGYIRNHAIAVSGYEGKPFVDGDLKQDIATAYTKAREIFGEAVSSILKHKVNSQSTFFIAPDGSKEDWDSSDKGDVRRKDFIEWLKSARYEDGSSSLSYVEFFYGDDEKQAEIVNHN